MDCSCRLALQRHGRLISPQRSERVYIGSEIDCKVIQVATVRHLSDANQVKKSAWQWMLRCGVWFEKLQSLKGNKPFFSFSFALAPCRGTHWHSRLRQGPRVSHLTTCGNVRCCCLCQCGTLGVAGLTWHNETEGKTTRAHEQIHRAYAGLQVGESGL